MHIQKHLNLIDCPVSLLTSKSWGGVSQEALFPNFFMTTTWEVQNISEN